MGELDALEGIIRATALYIGRVMGMLWFLPFFGQGTLSMFQKLGLSFVLGITVAFARGEAQLADPGAEPIWLALSLARELVFGLLLGWVASMVFDVAKIAGALIATEMGLNLSNQVDPNTGLTQPLLSQLFQSMAVLLFFLSGGHTLLFSALVSSFDGVPAGSFVIDGSLTEPLVTYTVAMIAAGVRMAAPVFVVMISVTICVGMLAKVAPNLHILEASYPIRILSALIMMILFLPELMSGFEHALDFMGAHLQMMAQGK